MSRQGVYSLNGVTPKIAADVFIAPGAIVVGDVEIGPGSSIWFNVVLRGDTEPIRIGARTNVQDGAVLHIDPGAPGIIGDDVTIGHGAIVHGAKVGHGVTIGMGAIVLSYSTIGDHAVIAAGAVVAERTDVPAGVLMMGIPAKPKRELEPELQERMMAGAVHYVRNGRLFRETLSPASTAAEESQHGG
jgi:carbonic anhydrase/acetyltransferase-like protein (isoleucine patch superfamily)